MLFRSAFLVMTVAQPEARSFESAAEASDDSIPGKSSGAPLFIRQGLRPPLMLRPRPVAIIALAALFVCLASLWPRSTHSDNILRRITNTTEDGLSLNPSISGDGRRVTFESTEDLANAGGANSFRALQTDLATSPPQFAQLALSRAVAPGISQDGSRIVFASTSDPLGQNPDGNSEIFLYSGTLKQITSTTPASSSSRVQDGNFQPSLSDDGRFIAFSSNRDLKSQNADGNLEIFIFDNNTQAFTQITSSTNVVGSSNAKISGDGSRIAYVRDTGTAAAPHRDLVIQDRVSASVQVIAANANTVGLTYGRAISDNATRMVYSLQTATNTTQVFMFDSLAGFSRQVTSLGARATDVALNATISGDGKRIAFATRRNVVSTNSDGGVELFLYDVPTGQFSQLTNTSSAATAEIVSSLSDDGAIAAFNFPRVLSGAVANSDFANNSEIYTIAIGPRASSGTATILNGASFGNDPSSPKAVAPDSIAIAQGGALSSIAQQPQPLADGSFPLSAGGTTVTVNGRLAQILYVSAGQVNFLVPKETAVGPATVVVTNSENFQSIGSIMVLSTAPGVFTFSGNGLGEGIVLNADTLVRGPFDPTDGHLRLLVFATGARNGSNVTASIGGQAVTVEALIKSAELPGLDEIHILVPASLRGLGTLDVEVRSDSQASNAASVTLTGNSLRDIMINEVLADPPGSAATDLQGDANHDGVRSSGDDEFVELVNSTTHDIDMSGYQLLSRSSTATTDTLRLTFANGTILPACSAIVVFGGGNPDPSNPLFGGAQVVKATSSLSLSNTGGAVTLRDNTATVITTFLYGGSTGLNGGASQSLTRSPDVTGAFVLHQSASGSNGKLFSSGTRVSGAEFAPCPAIARVDITPASAMIDTGAKQQFTAHAFDAGNNEVFGVIFSWQSSSTAIATVDQTGLATAQAAGTVEIRATGRGKQSAPATLTVRDIPRVLTTVTVTPATATIPATGAQQFTGHGLDQFGNEINGLTFTWESTNTNVATIDQTGLATGISQGQSVIKASSGGVTGTATLNVSAPTVVVNEVLADPPGSAGADLIGDANHDGVRSASDDEFVELTNATSAVISMAGWTVRTRATGGTAETLRHTFAAGTALPAGEAIVIFGGGNVNLSDPIFGCAQIVKASSGGLSLTNTGLTILVRDNGGNLVSQMSYGSEGNNDDSLTRSPDITGSYVQHLAATGANGRRFSPGLKVDGTPFGNCPGHPAAITIAPLTASVVVGQTTQFTAQAFDQFGRAMIGVPITFASDNTAAATVESVSTNPGTGVATATVKGQNQGTAHITAQANDGTTTATSSQATLTVIPPQPQVTRIDVTPTTATINRGRTQQFSAAAFDQNNQPVAALFTWTSGNTSVATIDQAGLASGVGIGASTITASASDGAGGTVSGTAMLTVQVPLVINEINADVGADNVATTAIEGDANRDGVRDSADDEFVELFNNSSAAVDISGIVIADGTSNRFTIPASTILNAGRALVIFGGGAPPVNDPAFGGALVLVSSATLSLNDGGDTVNVKLNVGGSDVLIASQTYAGSGNPPAPSDQSLTRSPDAEVNSAGGGFVAHSTTTNAAGRVFSPGTRADGTPFGSPAITRIDVTPASATINGGATQVFTAHAFSNIAGPEVEIQNVCFIWDSSDTAKATVAPITGVTTTATGIAAGSPTIRARAGGQLGTATLTINVPPTLTINDVSQNEGNSGPTIFHFVVSLSAPALAGGVTFDIATQDATATVTNSDYVARALVGQTIAAGQQTYAFDVTVNGDSTVEPNETFNVNVTNVSGAVAGDGQAVGTIQNDDSPQLTINDVTASEGNSGSTTFTFTVTSTLPAPTGGITFDIATADATATAGSDYINRSLTNQTIAAGQTSYTFDVTVNGDLLFEPDETFQVNISNVNGATLSDGQGLGTIQNDDTAGLVISQVYGGGDNSGAPFRNDFVEIYNRGTTTVDFAVTPYSVQYAGVGSNFSSSNKTNLITGTVAPGRYFLVQEAGGTTNGVALPTPDATGTIAMGSTSGKVALVLGTTALAAAACPGDDGATPFNPATAGVSDFVGYGNSAATAGHCYEGAGPAAAPSNTTADFRKAGGCVDTNDNAADFLTASPSPHNSSSPIGACQADITINDVTVTEGNTGIVNATFTVSLSAISANTVTVNFATADGTATQPADYQANSGLLTFNPGDLTKTITILVNGDTLDEPSETFFVNLSNPVNGSLVDGQGQGSITDNDPTPSLSINDVTVAEGDSLTTTATFTVTLSAASGQAVTVNFATADNTAVAGSDYQANSGLLTFNPGDTTKTVNVLVNGDTSFEQNETYFVNLTSPTNATISDNQGLGTITNDDATPPTPTLFISDVTIAEGNSGTSVATFNVTLSPASGQTVTVDFATANDTATTAGNDYQSASGQLTFNPGDTSKPVSVTVKGDTLVEPDETFFVNLSNASPGITIGDPQGLGTIQNDDASNLVISQTYPGGGLTNASFTNDFVELFNRGTTSLDFSVTPYSVQFLSTGGSTWAKTDLTSGTIAPGQYFLVKESGGAVGAALPTADATGSLNLTSTTAGKVALVAGTTLLVGNCPGDDGSTPFNPVSGTVVDFVGYLGNAATANHCYEGSGPAAFTSGSNNIADLRKAGGCTDTNDNAPDFLVSGPFPRNSSSPLNSCVAGTPPNLTINDVTVAEGNTGTTTATFTVSLSGPALATDVTFDIATADSSATTANNDYVVRTLTNQAIPAGQTTYSFTVTVNGDLAIEPDETFLVNVTNVSGATLSDGQGVGTIQNDDQPALTINDVSQSEGNSGTSVFQFTVSLSAPAPATVTFDIATQDGTATTANSDYVARSLSGQTILAGATTYTFDVTVNGDAVVEPNETFSVNVTNVSGATIGDGQGTGTIQNDDSPILSITPAVSVAEGNSGTTNATFTVSLSPAINQTVTVDYATANGTATANGDYQTTSGTLTFNPLETSKPISVPVNGDTLVELNETFTLSLSNASANATVSPTQGTGTGTITNDDLSGVAISQVYPGGGLTGATYTNDFIELFNRGATTVDFSVTPHSVQFLSVSGSTWVKTDLTSGTLAPGQYFLIKETGGAVGAPLPAADATGTINITSTTAGKVALVTGTTLLTGNCPGDDGSTPFNPVDGTVIDFVGYLGTAATANHCYEGSGPASFSSGSNTTADFRKAGGCTDTNDNGADFLLATPFPRNSSAPTNSCTPGATPNMTINDVSLAEGNSGTTTATFTVSLSAPATATDITFDIATADGTATTANSDYVAKSLTNQILPAGQTTYSFSVTINGDLAAEPDETFLVNLTNVVGANLTDGQGIGTITNDDSATSSLSINDVSISEGNSGTKTLNFTVTLAPSSLQTVTVNYATADGTATTADSDYVSASGLLTFNPGETTKPVSVTINGDATIEPDETFFVNLSSPSNATIGDSQGQGTITNDDSSGSVTKLVISQVYGGGGNSGAAYQNDFVELFNAGTTTVDFSVTPYSVQYSSSAGSFTAGNKTDLTTGTMAPGQYFLVKLASGGAVGQTFTADVTNTAVNMSATDGKVALVVGTTLATTASGCPTAVTVADLIGYGSANCSETTATAVLSATKVALRNTGGCTDTGSNVADFTVTTVNASSPLPRNSSSPLSPCP